MVGWDTGATNDELERYREAMHRLRALRRPDRGELPRDPDADHLPPGLEELEGNPVMVSGIDRDTGELVHERQLHHGAGPARRLGLTPAALRRALAAPIASRLPPHLRRFHRTPRVNADARPRQSRPWKPTVCVRRRTGLTVELDEEGERSLACLGRVGETPSCRAGVTLIRRVENL